MYMYLCYIWSAYDDAMKVINAMSEWEEFTCIDFVSYNESDIRWIDLVHGSG